MGIRVCVGDYGAVHRQCRVAAAHSLALRQAWCGALLLHLIWPDVPPCHRCSCLVLPPGISAYSCPGISCTAIRQRLRCVLSLRLRFYLHALILQAFRLNPSGECVVSQQPSGQPSRFHDRGVCRGSVVRLGCRVDCARQEVPVVGRGRSRGAADLAAPVSPGLCRRHR